jgi:hypothetical protein
VKDDAVAENKTKPTKVSVAGFLQKKATGQQLADSQELIKLFRDVTGKPAKMWGPSIIGFGSYHYVYDSGREGDMPLLGFSPRKPALVLYIASSLASPALLARLGEYKKGGGCIYVKRLDDLDRAVLRKMVTASVKALRAKYPKVAGG